MIALRWLGRLLTFFLLLALLTAGGLAGFLWLRWQAGVAPLAGQARIEALEAPVEVAWMPHGIPVIRAASMQDAYVALGWLHARDRLWQMEIQRRTGAGRLSEILGAAALPIDRYVRLLGLYDRAEQDFGALDPDVQTALDAYAAGVNAWLEGHDRPLPPEFDLPWLSPEPWRPADSLVWAKIMALQLSGDWRDEMARAALLQTGREIDPRLIWPEGPGAGPVTLTDMAALDWTRLGQLLPELGPDRASNGWVAGPGRSGGPGAVLANDPHLQLRNPGLWYLARIETPELNLAGATMAGLPFHVLGQNDEIAWGMTSTGADLQDVYLEKIDPKDPERYLAPEGSRPFTRRSEAIDVLGRGAEILDVRETRHGPVLSDHLGEGARAPEGQVAALAFTALLPGDRTAESMYLLNRAHDWQSFRDALHLWRAPMQNVLYADHAGHIGLVAPGYVPIRKGAEKGLPLEGWNGLADWRGAVPFEFLPQALDPADGFIFNANNPLVGPDYPWYLTNRWESPDRAGRIAELAAGGAPVDLDLSARWQGDILSPGARRILPVMLARLPAGVAAPAPLAGWDYRMRMGSPAPLIYAAWLTALNEAVLADDLGPLAGRVWTDKLAELLETDSPLCDDRRTSLVEDCPAMLAASLATAMGRLEARWGLKPEDWRWGRAHMADLGHSILSRLGPASRLYSLARSSAGGADTLMRGAWLDSDGANFPNRHAAGYRAIYDLADPSRSRFMVATGQSAHPLSPYYGDMTPLWTRGQYVTMGPGDVAPRLGRLRLSP